MVAAALVNAERMSVLWPNLAAHLRLVATHRAPGIRSYAIDALRSVAAHLLSTDFKHSDNGVADGAKKATEAPTDAPTDAPAEPELPLILLPSRVPFDSIFTAPPRQSGAVGAGAGAGAAEGGAEGGATKGPGGVSPAELLGPLCDVAREATDHQADVREHVLVAVHSLLASVSPG